METIVGIFCIISAILYFIKIFSWLITSIKIIFNINSSSVLRELDKMKITPTMYIWGGIEHIIIFVTLILSSILLL